MAFRFKTFKYVCTLGPRRPASGKLSQGNSITVYNVQLWGAVPGAGRQDFILLFLVTLMGRGT